MSTSDIQRQALDDLFHTYGTRLSYRKAEFIIRPRETLENVFLIDAGLVKAYDITKYGEENLLIVRQHGEIFPIIWAISGEDWHPVIYEALTDCALWRIPRQTFVDFLARTPTALAPLVNMLVEMYRIHSERIFNLEYRTVRERLVSFLLTMADRFGRDEEGTIVIEAPLRHQDIASSINASRETTGREIAVLERRGLIRNNPSHFTLLDVAGLHKLLEG